MSSIRRPHGRLLAALAVFLMSTVPGCGWNWLDAGNLSFNIAIPLGLNGTIGLLNPDGDVIGTNPQVPSDPNDPTIPIDDL